MIFLIFLALPALAGGGFVKPKKLPFANQPEVVAFLNDQFKDDPQFKAMDSAGVYDLGFDCNGLRVFALTFFDVRLRTMNGEVTDASADFTGSAGTRVVIYTIDQKKINPLYDEALMDWWGAESKEPCANIRVLRRGLDQDGRMQTSRTKLVFRNGKYGAN